ncbi:MAG: hypothetical protein PHI86_00560 [Candidatus Omnitrophica bacterium]|nr:hypothetical protein [Candidatus Omnitrophota bacterium]HOX54230.1 hypothetical protein [Candidatus Omnitrophota bacterium]
MFSRQQILLQDWQVEYARFLSDSYDVSLSEAVRILNSIAMITVINGLYPTKYKPKITLKRIINHISQMQQGKMELEEFHKMISELYFEARKAVEFRFENKNESKKKNKK